MFLFTVYLHGFKCKVKLFLGCMPAKFSPFHFSIYNYLQYPSSTFLFLSYITNFNIKNSVSSTPEIPSIDLLCFSACQKHTKADVSNKTINLRYFTPFQEFQTSWILSQSGQCTVVISPYTPWDRDSSESLGEKVSFC